MHYAFLGEYPTSSWSARMQFGSVHKFGSKVHTRFRPVHSELEFCNGSVSLVCICIYYWFDREWCFHYCTGMASPTFDEAKCYLMNPVISAKNTAATEFRLTIPIFAAKET